MASVTIAASLVGGINVSKHTTIRRWSPVVCKASANNEEQVKMTYNKDTKKDEESSSINGRRDLMFAAAAAAACSLAGVALADVEPKRGSPEAKKKYAPVCVTMPTARICRY